MSDDRIAEALHNQFGKPGSNWASLSDAGKKRWLKKADRLLAALSAVGIAVTRD